MDHPETCTVGNCERPWRAMGRCDQHYRRLRTGLPDDIPVRAKGSAAAVYRGTISDPVARFWSRVDKSGDCWLWTGPPANNGYGQVTFKGKHYSAHRLAYTLEVGAVMPGLDVDHLCKVLLCCNPAHLEPVTRAENLRRSDQSRPNNRGLTKAERASRT